MTEYNANYISVDTRVEGPILPSNKGQLLRDCYMKDGFDVQGSIYANNLYAEGSGAVNGPVFAKREITLRPPIDSNGQMIFCRGISSGRTVMVDVSDMKTLAPVLDCSYTPLIIRGDICSGIVKLENAVVLGNVHCESAVIKDSIIIGKPIVEYQLDIENSVMISFDAQDVIVHGRNTLWVPFGVARRNIIFDKIRSKRRYRSSEGYENERKDSNQETIDIKDYNMESNAADDLNFENNDVKDLDLASDADISWIRYIGLCSSPSHGCGYADVACESHMNGTCQYKDVRFMPGDLVKVMKAERYRSILSIAPRLLDITTIQKTLREINTVLIGAIMFDHLDDSSRQKLLNNQFSRDHMLLIDTLSTVTSLGEE